nr:MAG TPA: hypothetical protein [Caudoviricetes sp.]
MRGVTSLTAFTAVTGRATCRSPSPIHSTSVKGNKTHQERPESNYLWNFAIHTKRMTRNSPNLAHRFMTTARPSSLRTAVLLKPPYTAFF